VLGVAPGRFLNLISKSVTEARLGTASVTQVVRSAAPLASGLTTADPLSVTDPNLAR